MAFLFYLCKMKIAMSGSRDFTDQNTIDEVLDKYKDVCTLIISGGAIGVDTLSEVWAQKNKIKTEIIKPNYTKYPNKSAPIIRNKIIIDKADMLIAFWNKVSKGTKSTIDFAIKKGIETIIIEIE